MEQNPYPNLAQEPLLVNQAPPPPPPLQNNPYNAFNQNQQYQQKINPPFNNNPNPSFNNNHNPSFNNNVPNYQQPYQPQYQQQYQQPGYVPYNQPQVIASVGNHQVLSNNGGVYSYPPLGIPRLYLSPFVRSVLETINVTRFVPGGVTWIWCFLLFILTGVCCCIPFCVNSCQDQEIVCATCQCVKGRIDANCC